MFKKIIKKILSTFNYKIISKNDWSRRVENLIVEATEKNLKEFEIINDISLSSSPNKWSLIQSLKHMVVRLLHSSLV